jgi:hypothetical protein
LNNSPETRLFSHFSSRFGRAELTRGMLYVSIRARFSHPEGEKVGIDITRDKLISLEDAAKMFPKAGGGHVHAKTVRNWITNGYHGIKLDGAQVGSKFYTTADALRTFSRRLNELRQARSRKVDEPHLEPDGVVPPPNGAAPAVDFTVANEVTAAGSDTLSEEDTTVDLRRLQPARNNP